MQGNLYAGNPHVQFDGGADALKRSGMSFLRYKRMLLIGAAATLTGTAIPFAANAALKYEPDSYVQDGLVVHLDGIRNVGANRRHDSSVNHWENLACPSNPAAITSNASSGWRDDGYISSHTTPPPAMRDLSPSRPR